MVPPADVERLCEAGAAAVFPVGSNLLDIPARSMEVLMARGQQSNPAVADG